jgi:hypothetical protein
LVAGHLQEKYGYYYAVLNYTDENGKRKTKWIATGLEIKGNKKRAEAILLEQRYLFEQKLSEVPVVNKDDILFADYMIKWLGIAKTSIAVPTYASYSQMVNKIIVPISGSGRSHSGN